MLCIFVVKGITNWKRGFWCELVSSNIIHCEMYVFTLPITTDVDGQTVFPITVWQLYNQQRWCNYWQDINSHSIHISKSVLKLPIPTWIDIKSIIG